MDKQFAVNDVTFSLDETALRAAFGWAVAYGNMTFAQAQARFDALEIGETLVDEDGDTWERIA